MIGIRESTPHLELDETVESNVFDALEEVLRVIRPYRREGYPRAGGFDRLMLFTLSRSGDNNVGMRYVYLNPLGFEVSGVIQHDISFDDLFVLNENDVPNIFVGAVVVENIGSMKYGYRDIIYGEVERGAMLFKLHHILCERGIKNRVHGGLRRSSFGRKFALLPGFSGVIGLIA